MNFDIVVMEQSPNFRFNRGALLNAGVLLLGGLDHDYYVFNDADTVPAKGSGLDYAFSRREQAVTSDPAKSASEVQLRRALLPELALANAQLDEVPRGAYAAQEFFGGIAAFSREQILAVNGHSTDFWGWGFEGAQLSDQRGAHYTKRSHQNRGSAAASKRMRR